MKNKTAEELKLVWAWVESLDEESNEYKNLPKTERGKINMKKINVTDIPKTFHQEYLTNIKPTNTLTTKAAIKLLTNIDLEGQTVTSISGHDSIIQVIHAMSIMKSGMARLTCIQELILKFDISYNRAAYIHHQAKEIIKANFQAEIPYLKDALYNDYRNLYESAVAKNNIKEARSVLDSIAKLTGANEPDKLEIDEDINITFED